LEKIIIGSGNPHKIREIKNFYSELNIKFEAIPKDADLAEVIEDGKSYRENALKKAGQRALELNEIVLADDSGLSVDYMDGAPGIYSARFGGEGLNDREKYLKILKIMKGVPKKQRKAAFISAVALVDPFSAKEIVVEGRVEGIIAEHPSGKNGFGYDPIFYLPKYDKTMAEISEEQKNKISHRAAALKKMEDVLIKRYME